MNKKQNNTLPPGHQLEDYTIESVLGSGSFGITYLAVDKSLGSKVAIKEYLPIDYARRQANGTILPLPSTAAIRFYKKGLEMFLQEARALAQFKHENIVRVLRFVNANGTAYMVMEYEQGVSLGSELRKRKKPLSERELMRVFLPILSGLKALHDVKILHLDIKPDNIYIRQNGVPMLIDFGSARGGFARGEKNQPLTLTPAFSALEQYPGQGETGAWTDIYAIGCSMYQCITLRLPRPALERYQSIMKYKPDPVVAVTSLFGTDKGKSDMPPTLLKCIEWAMRVHLNDRPRSVINFQDALVGKYAVPEKASMLGTVTARKKSNVRWGRVFAVVSIATVLAGAAVYYQGYVKTWVKRYWPSSIETSGKVDAAAMSNKTQKRQNTRSKRKSR